MARFLVKASEFKNVCKAVNDRQLESLKKEIIEILKKQDENEVKKAVDYFNSQELHYTHLEKSLSGKWIEKAGYGIGTVRVWKGKKYKKIAPDKWVRVFDKEGRGTNIAIGKLIARVQKIDNVEDLMAFVMANKQRFVDENGVDLPVLDKLRAAVGVKNENLSGESSSYTYGVGEDVSREKNKIFEGKEKITKEEADLHKVSRKFEQIPTTELKQRKAKLERWIENKTRSKRDSLNNAIFRESYQKELDAINAVLDKRNEKKETTKPAEKYDDDKAYKEYQKLLMKENPTTADNERLGELVTEHYKHSKKEWIGGQGLKELNAAKDENKVLSNGKTVKEVREQYGIESKKPAEKKTDSKVYENEKENILRHTNQDYNSVDEALVDLKRHIDFINRNIPSDETDAEKETRESKIKATEDIMNGLKDGDKALLKKFVKESDFDIDSIKGQIGAVAMLKDQMETWPKEKLTELYKDKLEKIKNNKVPSVAMQNVKNQFVAAKELLNEKYKNDESEFEKTQNRSDAMKGNKNAYKGKSDEELVKIRESFQAFGKRSPYFKDMSREEYESSLDEMYEEIDKRNLRNVDSDSFNKKNTTKSPFKVFADKEPVGTFEKYGDNAVVMDATKEQKALFDSLNKAVSKDSGRPFMTDCYYDGENIISTDGRRLVCIKAGNIGLDEGFVKVKTENGKVKIEKFEKDFGDSQVRQFPNYKRVMPENNTQEVQLNQKVLKEKLKTMKKEGAWDSKKNFRIVLEFVDGKVMLDGTQVGTADGVKFDSDEQNININAEYLADALGNEDSVSMFVSDNPTKAFSLSDNVSDIVIMPMYGDENSVPDYEARRAEKAGAKAEKEKKERDYKVANKKRIEDSMSRTNVDELVDKRASEVDEWLKKDDEFLERTYEQMNYNLDKDLGRKEFLSVGDKVGKGRKFTVMSVYMHNKLAEKHPEVKEKLEAELEKRGISVKKSLFDGFLLENLIEEDIDDMEEDEEEGSLWNDYSAEQPELFNSTEFKVREAMNRCKVL